MYKLIYEEYELDPTPETFTTSSRAVWNNGKWIRKIHLIDAGMSKMAASYNITITKFLSEGNRRFVDFLKV